MLLICSGPSSGFCSITSVMKNVLSNNKRSSKC